MRRTALAALCCGSAAALAGLPTLDLYLDLRMTVRGPADALETIAAQPDGLILWESAAAPDWGDGWRASTSSPWTRAPRMPRASRACGAGAPAALRAALRHAGRGRLCPAACCSSTARRTSGSADAAAHRDRGGGGGRHREVPCRPGLDDARAGRRARPRRDDGARCRRSARPAAPAPAASASRCRPTRASGSTPRRTTSASVRRCKIDVHTSSGLKDISV